MRGSEKKELKKDQVYRLILERMQKMSAGENRFPSEPEFCRELGVSRITLRNALSRLEKEGRITRSHYYGTRPATIANRCRILIMSNFIAEDPANIQSVTVPAIENYARQYNAVCDRLSYCFLQDSEKISQKYCGIICLGAAIRGDEGFIRVLRQCTIPVVFCREDYINRIESLFPSVGIDKRKAWFSGLEYLASLGYRRVLSLISADWQRNFERMGIRKEQYALELKKRGLDADSDLILPVTPQDIADSVLKNLRAAKPEAVFCYSDYYAVQVCRALQRAGVRIPQDVSILGFDGCPGGELLSPALSSVDLAYELCGQSAVKLLLDPVLSVQRPPVHITLPSTIRPQESTCNCNLRNLCAGNKSNRKNKNNRRSE